MTGWRRMVRNTIPAVVAACLLVPGLWATPVHRQKRTRHSVAKHHPRRARSNRVRVHKKKRTRRVYHRTAYHRRYHRRYRRRYHRMPARPTSSRIEQIQRALSRSGFYQGDPTGRWDAATIDAMKSFQQAHGLPSTGKIDARSLQKLGLGSDIAGLAPPRPVITTDPNAGDKNSKGAGGR